MEVTLSSTVVAMVVAMVVVMGEARGKGVFNTLQWNTMVIKTGFYCLTKDLVHKVET